MPVRSSHMMSKSRRPLSEGRIHHVGGDNSQGWSRGGCNLVLLRMRLSLPRDTGPRGRPLSAPGPQCFPMRPSPLVQLVALGDAGLATRQPWGLSHTCPSLAGPWGVAVLPSSRATPSKQHACAGSDPTPVPFLPRCTWPLLPWRAW